MGRIYLDYASATPIDPRVARVVFDCEKLAFANASSLHDSGLEAKKILEDSRRKIAGILKSRPEEIVFTGSGTESANLAVLGIARAYKKSGKHIIVSQIEHSSVLRACEFLEKNEGFKVSRISVGKNGIVNPETVKKHLREDTILVSVMYANNEIGTIQPIKAIAKILKDFRNRALKIENLKLKTDKKPPIFHTDACQAAGALDLDVQKLGVDLMTLNGSKVYGPKGVGCLFVRNGVDLAPVILGGNQERGLRAGTENVPAIAGFAKALEIADEMKEKEDRRLVVLRDYFISRILKKIPGVELNGDPIERLPNNINLFFPKTDGEMLVLKLSQLGIEVSTGSACDSDSGEPSHVIEALKIPNRKRGVSIRVSLGRQTTKKDVDHVLNELARCL